MAAYSVEPTLQEYLQERSIPVPESGCWLWMTAQTEKGYGKGRYPGYVTRRAHKLSWIAFRGEVPENLIVCHKCDTPSCINPNHLYLGTNAQNQADKRRKISEAYAKRTHCLHGHELTESNQKDWLDHTGKRYIICRECSRLALVKQYNKVRKGQGIPLQLTSTCGKVFSGNFAGQRIKEKVE